MTVYVAGKRSLSRAYPPRPEAARALLWRMRGLASVEVQAAERRPGRRKEVHAAGRRDP